MGCRMENKKGLTSDTPFYTLTHTEILTIHWKIHSGRQHLGTTAAHAIAKGAYASGVALWEKTVVDKYAEQCAKAKS